MRVHYEQRELLLRPETENESPSVAVRCTPSLPEDAATALLNRFLSAVAWVEQGALEQKFKVGGGHPIHVGKGPEWGLSGIGVRFDYLPQPQDERGRLALALYREAQSVNLTPYKFLAFFKIINTLFSAGSSQQNWINSTIGNLSGRAAVERLAQLRKTESDVGKYLYASGRFAVAHAFGTPVVNPDDPADQQRLARDLPLIQALAEHAIEHELKIKSQATVRQEHLYELDGFHRLFSPQQIDAMKSGVTVNIGQLPELPQFHIRVRDHAPIPAFEHMSSAIAGAFTGGLVLACTSRDRRLQFSFGLSFQAERIAYDLLANIVLTDDQSPEAVQNAIDHANFLRAMIANGELEIWNADAGELLGRTDPCIPVNIDLPGTLEDLAERVRKLEELAQERERARPNPPT